MFISYSGDISSFIKSMTKHVLQCQVLSLLYKSPVQPQMLAHYKNEIIETTGEKKMAVGFLIISRDVDDDSIKSRKSVLFSLNDRWSVFGGEGG